MLITLETAWPWPRNIWLSCLLSYPDTGLSYHSVGMTFSMLQKSVILIAWDHRYVKKSIVVFGYVLDTFMHTHLIISSSKTLVFRCASNLPTCDTLLSLYPAGSKGGVRMEFLLCMLCLHNCWFRYDKRLAPSTPISKIQLHQLPQFLSCGIPSTWSVRQSYLTIIVSDISFAGDISARNTEERVISPWHQITWSFIPLLCGIHGGFCCTLNKAHFSEESWSEISVCTKSMNAGVRNIFDGDFCWILWHFAITGPIQFLSQNNIRNRILKLKISVLSQVPFKSCHRTISVLS